MLLIIPFDQTLQESVFTLVTGVVGVVHTVHKLLLELIVVVEREVD